MAMQPTPGTRGNGAAKPNGGALSRRDGNGQPALPTAALSPAALGEERARVLVPAGPERPPHLGEVVRDAMDHARVIARDSMTLGRLEAERVVDKAKGEVQRIGGDVKAAAGDIVPRVAFGIVAAFVGFVGVVFAFLAAWFGLGYAIHSLALRFLIFAVFFLLVAGAAAARAAYTKKPKDKAAPKVEARTRAASATS